MEKKNDEIDWKLSDVAQIALKFLRNNYVEIFYFS